MFFQQTEIRFVENSQGIKFKGSALSGFGYETSGQADTLQIMCSFDTFRRRGRVNLFSLTANSLVSKSNGRGIRGSYNGVSITVFWDVTPCMYYIQSTKLHCVTGDYIHVL
jgi:hypothetical protein